MTYVSGFLHGPTKKIKERPGNVLTAAMIYRPLFGLFTSNFQNFQNMPENAQGSRNSYR